MVAELASLARVLPTERPAPVGSCWWGRLCPVEKCQSQRQCTHSVRTACAAAPHLRAVALHVADVQVGLIVHGQHVRAKAGIEGQTVARHTGGLLAGAGTGAVARGLQQHARTRLHSSPQLRSSVSRALLSRYVRSRPCKQANGCSRAHLHDCHVLGGERRVELDGRFGPVQAFGQRLEQEEAQQAGGDVEGGDDCRWRRGNTGLGAPSPAAASMLRNQPPQAEDTAVPLLKACLPHLQERPPPAHSPPVVRLSFREMMQKQPPSRAPMTRARSVRVDHHVGSLATCLRVGRSSGQ